MNGPVVVTGATGNVGGAAAATGIGHVVFSSVLGADTSRLLPHHRVESHLRASGLHWTALRPGFFAQNLADAYRADVVEDDRLHVPVGSAKVAFLDTRDIGDAAAAVFADPAAHRGAAHTLTGGEALGFADVAAVLGGELGRPIRYEPATVPGYFRHLRHRGPRPDQCLVQTLLHADLRGGRAEVVDPALPSLLGRPARTLRQYAREHISTWARR